MIKFYDIDREYIEFLKLHDKQVPDVEYSKNNKFVCGVVLHLDELNIDYYVPISHMTGKQQTNIQILDRNVPIATMRFSFMLPAYSGVLKEKNFSDISKLDKKYADLLNAEYRFCVRHEDDILKKALSVYKIGCNKNHKLNYTCCDFKKLESVYKLYERQRIQQEVASAKEEAQLNDINSFE